MMKLIKLFAILGVLPATSVSLATPDAGAPSVAPGKAKSGPPAALQGAWDVEQVAVDGQDQIHWGHRPNDPQLLYRTLTIDAQGIGFNGANLACKQARWPPRSTTWGQLLAKGFPRPPVGGRKAIPAPNDFDIQVAVGGKVTAYQVCPDLEPKAVFPASRWVAVKGPDAMAFRIDSSALLLLKRRAPDAKPQASFPCAKATSVTEKAICASFELAAWDRSVAAAWREVTQRKSSEELLANQKDWLKKRYACGATVSCLEDEMFSRLEHLVQQTNW